MPSTWQLTQTFLNPTPGAIGIFDQFGGSVAIDGNNALVGALGADRGATDTGAAYLFDTTTGNLLRTFLNPTPATQDYFGGSVAIDGNNVLIGALFDDNTGVIDAGAAYLFDATTGNLLRTFLNPTPATEDYFGNSVAISGNNVLIGARLDNTGAIDAGAAYLFDATTGNLLRTFLNPTPANDDRFGGMVAISGNNVLIGAIGDDAGATNAGAAYLFNATTGSLLRTFLNPTPTFNEQFGWSVAISGNNVLIGAIGDDTGATNTGVAYLFNATTGSLLQTFLNPIPEPEDQLGRFAAISANNVLVGTILHNTGGADAGAAYLFDGTTGSLLQTFFNPSPAVTDYFGTVAISGNNVLIGAMGDDTGGTNAGAAYLYKLVDTATLSINDVTVTEGNSGTTNAVFTVSLSSAASTVVSVNYATANGTATAGTDYTALPTTTLTFNPGETSKTITVAVNGDNQVELNETFFLNLSNLQANGSNVTLADNQGQGTITNDDSASIAITDVTITEGNSGTTNAVFTVTLSNAVDTAVTVNYATADGTATTTDNDYTAIATTPLIFNAGETSKTITVAVNGDTKVESNETFFVNLSNLQTNGRNVTLADNQGQGTITNDDVILPSITLAVSPSSVNEDGTTNLVYTFTRTGSTTSALTANYTVGGTATFSTDYTQTGAASYTATTGTVNFVAGSATATVTVDPTADTT
ncbi:MAG: hypothetical protein IM502_06775, partial [Microcystis sp. M045S2]|uniref:Calx-beta domain-containing protein n=1 Tax=Microcystis sp. M045S2 TaxID=2771167 RepID=UPI00258B854B